MHHPFKIYTDRLKEGQTENIDEHVPPTFLDVHESALQFQEPVAVAGEAYLADEHLVLRLHIKTTALIPCAICNQTVKINIDIQNFYHTEPLPEMKWAIFEYTEQLREAILLQVPAYAECSAGRCPERENIKKFLKSPSQAPTHQSFPFAELDKT